MSKDAINFLTNLKEEVDKYIADVDLEAVEKRLISLWMQKQKEIVFM